MSVNECMKKHNLNELRNLIDKHKLAKGLKQRKKEKMCEALRPFLKKQRSSSISYQINQQMNTNESATKPPLSSSQSEVSIQDCMKNYLLSDLKAVVDQHHLPKGLKLLNKRDLCFNVHNYLKKGVNANKGAKAKK